METTYAKDMTYAKFKIVMDAIDALKHKVQEHGDEHPLIDHYYKIIDQMQFLPFNTYQNFYVRWSMQNRFNHTS